MSLVLEEEQAKVAVEIITLILTKTEALTLTKDIWFSSRRSRVRIPQGSPSFYDRNFGPLGGIAGTAELLARMPGFAEVLRGVMESALAIAPVYRV